MAAVWVSAAGARFAAQRNTTMFLKSIVVSYLQRSLRT